MDPAELECMLHVSKDLIAKLDAELNMLREENEKLSKSNKHLWQGAMEFSKRANKKETSELHYFANRIIRRNYEILDGKEETDWG